MAGRTISRTEVEGKKIEVLNSVKNLKTISNTLVATKIANDSSLTKIDDRDGAADYINKIEEIIEEITKEVTTLKNKISSVECNPNISEKIDYSHIIN